MILTKTFVPESISVRPGPHSDHLTIRPAPDGDAFALSFSVFDRDRRGNAGWIEPGSPMYADGVRMDRMKLLEWFQATKVIRAEVDQDDQLYEYVTEARFFSR